MRLTERRLRLGIKNFLKELGQAEAAIEVETIADARRWTQIAAEPIGDVRRTDPVGAENLEQTEIAEALGADLLLVARAGPRNDEGMLLEGQDLVDRVVAAHGDDAVRVAEQDVRVSDELEYT